MAEYSQLRTCVRMCCYIDMAWESAIKFAQQVIGEDRVMYAMDYPYQYELEEVRSMDIMTIPAALKRKFMQTNAERWFGLSRGQRLSDIH